ncbi:MAG: pseudoazurin [Rhodobacteraceae bacterium]|nr:pseudoazurin [Paracoccaceae bacterium]
MLFSRRTFIASSAAILATPYVARANTPFVVQMLNKHPEDRKQRQIFLPRLAVIEAGESVLFQATDRGHNSASADGMMPEGAEPWKGALGKDIEVNFTVPGVYGYVCTPHVSAGMVGAVVVRGAGVLDNLEAAKAVKQRGKAKKIFGEIFAEIDALDLSA